MGYIPANPHFAVVNCKIGDLNLTPIPPDTLESFTFERDTNQGGGNKFSITVYDETAIVMESYLAEVAFKEMQGQSYEFDTDNIYEGNKLKDEYVLDDINKKQTPERVKFDSEGNRVEEQSDEPVAQAMSISQPLDELPQISSLSDIPTFYSNTFTEEEDKVEIRQDNTNLMALRAKSIDSNENTYRLAEDTDTNMIAGPAGISSTVDTSPIYSINDPVIPNQIDDSKLNYADPSTGLREIFGYKIPDDVYVGEKALQEFRGGKGEE